VAKGYNKEEGIEFYETYVFVARLEDVRLFLVYACNCGFKLFHIDVKNAFLKWVSSMNKSICFTTTWL